MKWRAPILGMVLAATTAGAGLAIAVEAPPGDPEVIEMLSGMSYIPDRDNIEAVMGPTAVEDLIELAEDTSASSDSGVRIRALRALGQFAQSPSRPTAAAALRRAILTFGGEVRGVKLLYLRTSMLSLASLEGANAVSSLVDLLAHPSRDIRAGCSQALGITKSDTAIPALRDRALIEEQPQVQLAIADALFQLGSAQ